MSCSRTWRISVSMPSGDSTSAPTKIGCSSHPPVGASLQHWSCSESANVRLVSLGASERRWSRDRTHPSMVPAPPVTEHRLMLNVCLLLFRLCDGGQVLYDLVRRILQFDQMSIVFVDGL